MRRKLLLLELNEINFDYVGDYADRGLLPTLRRLLAEHGLARTTSESRYEELEPWIQWVTAHTGKTLAEHGVFRLGDIVAHDIPQIWEMLEDRGLRVGAISPMNAKLRIKRPAFFVPDPWTSTGVAAPSVLQRMYGAIRQAVNDNAQERITVESKVALLAGAARYARPTNFGRYASLAAGSRSGPWRKSMFLDLLLTDVFVGEVKRTRPDFASLFLNAGAHIQHHYMFSSSAYRGRLKNPPWYLPQGVDPVLEVYRLYDAIVAQVIAAFPDSRVMIATGLHQEPHEELTYYWRLRDHAAFLEKVGIAFESVEPRMSRDFLVAFRDADAAASGCARLASAVAADGVPLFDVDNRGRDAFVMLTYPRDIDERTTYSIGEETFTDLRGDVAFVAVKNGHHDGIGYFLDTGERQAQEKPAFPLAALPERIFSALATP